MSHDAKKPPVMPEHTQRFLLKRREFMKTALMGSLGYGAFAFLKHKGIGGVSAFLRHVLNQPGLASMDAAEIIADALRFGPSLLFVSEALAAETTGPAIFRVMYQTSHDIRNELCLTDYGNMYNPFSTLNYGAAAAGLQTKIQKAPDPHPIMNAWAHKLMTTGKIDGTTAFPGVADKPALTPDQIARISVIAAVGMGGTAGVHQRGNIPRVGSLEYAMLTAYGNYSPIGSVSTNAPIVDSSGGVNNPGTTVSGFINAIDIPAVYMSREKEANPVRALDGLTGDKEVKAIRDQMLDAHFLLTQQLNNIKGYIPIANQKFMNYGARELEGLASMMLFADLFKNGLATVGSTGLNSFDFHATDALRTPAGPLGNMLTETSQALAGVFHIASACFESKKDAIVHFTTCSNRNETWVVDDGHVSTMTFIIKGSDSSPFKDVPAQQVLISDKANQVYAEGPGNDMPSYSGKDAEALGMTGAGTVGRLEAGIVKAAGKAAGKEPSLPVEEPAAKII